MECGSASYRSGTGALESVDHRDTFFGDARTTTPAPLVTNITPLAQHRPDTLAMQRHPFLLGSTIILLALLALGATPTGMAPLPAQYLHDGTFQSPDGWFAIHVPLTFEWFEMRAFDEKADPRWPDAINQTVGWLARDPKTFDDLVVLETYEPGGNVITAGFARSFEARTRKAVEPETMSEYRAELLTISGEQSLHFRYRLVGKTHKPLYRFGYVTGMQHKLMLSTSDERPEEPKRLRQSVVSIRWLKMP